MAKIVAAGHTALDISPIFSPDKIFEGFLPGKLTDIDGASVHVGGSVSNTGLALNFFGADVALVGKIGKDYFGDIVLKIYKEHNADKHMIVSEEGGTSLTIVLSPPGRDRTFLHNSGVNHTFCYDDLDFEMIQQADFFHLGYPTIMEKLYSNEGAELIKIFKKVKELGLKTSLDIAFIDPQSAAYQVDWKEVLTKVLPYVDFFTPSVEELCAMLDKETFAKWQEMAKNEEIITVLSIEKDIMPLAEQVIALGAKGVLIKCSSLGMLLKTSNEIATLGDNFEQWANLTLFENSFVADSFVSSTGAGDTSIAAFLKAIMDGHTPSRCLQYATATGASCVTAYDSLGGLLSFEAIDRKIQNGWEKNKNDFSC